MENETFSFGELTHGQIFEDISSGEMAIKVFDNKIFDGEKLKLFNGFINKKCWRILDKPEILPVNQQTEHSLLGNLSVGDAFAVYEEGSDEDFIFAGIKIAQDVFMKANYCECSGDHFNGLFQFQTNFACFRCNLSILEIKY